MKFPDNKFNAARFSLPNDCIWVSADLNNLSEYWIAVSISPETNACLAARI